MAEFLPGLAPDPAARGEPLMIAVRGQEVLAEELGGAGGRLRLPQVLPPALLAGAPVYLGTLDGRSCFGVALVAEAAADPPLRVVPARRLLGELPAAELEGVGQALALVEWDVMSRYCGRCGAVTLSAPEGERARTCPLCGARFHPRVSPAVIVLVHRDREILLARNAQFPPGRFSAVAGFVETGESLEQAAGREVKEEVGVTITDLRYFGSQPWPFGRSLMIGFTARWAAGDIRVDGREIVEAGWFAPERMPDLPPPVSIARRLIDDFVGGGEPSRA